jgi:hypothetical protein
VLAAAAALPAWPRRAAMLALGVGANDRRDAVTLPVPRHGATEVGLPDCVHGDERHRARFAS